MRWHVYKRYIYDDISRSAWCVPGRQYRNKKDAHKAVRDLNNNNDGREYIALPDGMIPTNTMTFRNYENYYNKIRRRTFRQYVRDRFLEWVSKC